MNRIPKHLLFIGFIALLLCVQFLGPQQAISQVTQHRLTAPFVSESDSRASEHGTLLLRLRSLAGLIAFGAITCLIGQLRRPKQPIPWRTVGWGLAIQLVFAWLVLDTVGGRWAFQAASNGVNALLSFVQQGAGFVFGDLVQNDVPVGKPAGAGLSGPILNPIAYAHTGAFFAFNVLPTIVFFCALSALLYYIGIMQYVVQGIAWIMQRSMKTSGAETLAAAANIFLGQTEAPLMVKPFLAKATNSELMAMMTAGFANIASGVLAAYVVMLRGFFPDIAGHLLAASLLSAPSSLVVAKLIMPETEPTQTPGGVKLQIERTDANAIDATTRGSLEGLTLALNVGAVLIVFIAIVALLNSILSVVGGWFHHSTLSFEEILGWVATPLAWLTGIPWHDAKAVGPLLGIKTAINEFVAYLRMSQMLAANPSFVSPRSAIITAYALCGFANFASVGIQIGGISGMAPNRRHDLSKLGLIAMVGGALSSFMAACMVGVLL